MARPESCLQRISVPVGSRNCKYRELLRSAFFQYFRQLPAELFELGATLGRSFHFTRFPDEKLLLPSAQQDRRAALHKITRRRQQPKPSVFYSGENRDAVTAPQTDAVFMRRHDKRTTARREKALNDAKLQRRQFSHKAVESCREAAGQATAALLEAAWESEDSSSETAIARRVAMSSSRETLLLRN